jgi:hypothetical protein
MYNAIGNRRLSCGLNWTLAAGLVVNVAKEADFEVIVLCVRVFGENHVTTATSCPVCQEIDQNAQDQ